MKSEDVHVHVYMYMYDQAMMKGEGRVDQVRVRVLGRG